MNGCSKTWNMNWTTIAKLSNVCIVMLGVSVFSALSSTLLWFITFIILRFFLICLKSWTSHFFSRFFFQFLAIVFKHTDNIGIYRFRCQTQCNPTKTQYLLFFSREKESVKKTNSICCVRHTYEFTVSRLWVSRRPHSMCNAVPNVLVLQHNDANRIFSIRFFLLSTESKVTIFEESKKKTRKNK